MEFNVLQASPLIIPLLLQHLDPDPHILILLVFDPSKNF